MIFIRQNGILHGTTLNCHFPVSCIFFTFSINVPAVDHSLGWFRQQRNKLSGNLNLLQNFKIDSLLRGNTAQFHTHSRKLCNEHCGIYELTCASNKIYCYFIPDDKKKYSHVKLSHLILLNPHMNFYHLIYKTTSTITTVDKAF